VLVDWPALRIENCDARGWRALHWAAHTDKAVVAMRLLGRGAMPNPQADEGETPLHLSVAHPDAEASLTRLLVSAGALLEARGSEGMTPLHVAVTMGRHEQVAVLVSLGADCEAVTIPAGLSALHLAALQGHTQCVATLLRGNATADQQDAAGQTALHLAARDNRQEAVLALCEGGASLSLVDRRGASALHLACKEV
jgi:ankyrin repeat protein